MCMRTPPRKFQSPDCGNFIDTNVFNQTFRIYTQTMMEKTFFDVQVFNPNAFSNRNQTPFACYRKHKREKKRTYAQRILEVEHSSFTPLVFSATCRRNRERSNLFLQMSWLLYACFEVGSLIQHHTLLAEMPIDLLPVCSAIQSLRRARSSQHHVVHSPPTGCRIQATFHFYKYELPIYKYELSIYKYKLLIYKHKLSIYKYRTQMGGNWFVQFVPSRLKTKQCDKQICIVSNSNT